MNDEKIRQILIQGETCKKKLNGIGTIGPMGPTGPQGLIGPTGPATMITVAKTNTIASDEPASVDSTFTPNGVELTFNIPQGSTGAASTVPGPTGPQGLMGPTGTVVLSYGSLRGVRIETPTVGLSSVPFQTVGPLSETITVSQTGNELIVGTTGIYQITISINAESTTDPDLDQPYLEAIITVNGVPIFGGTSTYFKIPNRANSTFVTQAALTAGDFVGASISSSFPVLGYRNRSLTLIQLS